MHHLGKHTVWIDSLYINQEDEFDKGMQVAQMGAVYAYASEVLTVLSSPTTETDLFFDPRTGMWKLSRHNMITRLTYQSSLILPALDMTRKSPLLRKTNPVSNSTSHPAVDGGNFREAESDLFSNGGRMRYRNILMLNLLFRSLQFSRCYDPKDILHARRSLASDGEQLISEISYSDDVPFERLCKEFTTCCMTNSPDSDCLEIITRASCHSEIELSSWVPNWSLPAPCCQTYGEELKDGLLSKISWSNTRPTISVNGDELHVHGRILAIIAPETLHHFATDHGTLNVIRKVMVREIHLYHVDDYSQTSDSPPLEIGDHTCLLKGCPAIIFLHPSHQGGETRYTVVGKHARLQERAVMCCFGQSQKAKEKGNTNWARVLRVLQKEDVKTVNAIPE